MISSNVRIIAATNQDLAALVQQQRFRADLYYRLNIYPLQLPSLSERKEDIAPLVHHYLGIYSLRQDLPVPTLTADAIDACRAYQWPGNVGELETFVQRLLLHRSGEPVNGDEVCELLGCRELSETGPLRFDVVAKRHIETVLRMTRGVIGGSKGAAALLGLHTSTLRYRIRQLGICVEQYRS